MKFFSANLILIALLMTGCSFVPSNNQKEAGTTDTSAQSKESSESSTKKTNKLEVVQKFEGFKSPTGIAVDSKGNIYVANWSGGNIAIINTQGETSTFADHVGSPSGLAVDADDNLYVADYSNDVIYKIAKGEKTIFAQGLHTPAGITFSKSGDLLVANRSSNEIVRIKPNGEIIRIADGFQTPVGVVESDDGSFYVSNFTGGISSVGPNGLVNTISTDFVTPGVGITINSQGELIVVDHGEGSIKKLDKDWNVTTLIDGLSRAVGLVIKEDGTLYVTAWGGEKVYELKNATAQ